MDFITIVALAVGLSFDTFAVSLSFGVFQNKIIFREAFRIALVMAFFQSGLFVTGYFTGSLISEFMRAADHWIALILLNALGIRMIIEGSKKKKQVQEEIKDYNNSLILFSMAVSTSIDALAVGISFALLNDRIWYSTVILGTITFLASMIAIRIGKSAGSRLGENVGIIGGLILMVIGVKIFLEHTW
jgi:putative Mn2+ efflux pump MntP